MMNDKCTVAAVIHMVVMWMAFRKKTILVMAEACCRDGWSSITIVIQDAISMFADGLCYEIKKSILLRIENEKIEAKRTSESCLSSVTATPFHLQKYSNYLRK
jgi:hypothetical protein